jgi:2'-5' RNA ligase
VRLFVAAYPSIEALDDLERVVADLHVAQAVAEGVNARLSARALWHITLAFLGEVDDAMVAEAGRAIDRAAEPVHPCALRIAGGGHFGRNRFTLLWAGVGGDVAGLTRIARAVRRELRASRITFDEKRFNPHITLARPGDRLPMGAVDEDISALNAYRSPQWTCTEIMLVASHQGPHPTHEPLHVATLR